MPRLGDICCHCLFCRARRGERGSIQTGRHTGGTVSSSAVAAELELASYMAGRDRSRLFRHRTSTRIYPDCTNSNRIPYTHLVPLRRKRREKRADSTTASLQMAPPHAKLSASLSPSPAQQCVVLARAWTAGSRSIEFLPSQSSRVRIPTAILQFFTVASRQSKSRNKLTASLRRFACALRACGLACAASRKVRLLLWVHSPSVCL